MADVTPIDAADVAQDATPSQFVARVRLRTLLAALAGRWQALDDVLQALQVAFSVDDAAGVQLDTIGALVGQQRYGGAYPAGETDSVYRNKIRARALRNRSGGTADDLIAIMLALLPDKVAAVQVVDLPPAAFALGLSCGAALTSDDESIVVEFAQAARAAGVRIDAICWYVDPTFAFDGFPDPPFAGFDDGFWAHYFYP